MDRGVNEASSLSNREVEDLYAAYGHLVFGRVQAVLRNSALAHDALQDVFVKVIRHGAALHCVDSKLAWLYTVADRCCIDIIKRGRKHQRVDSDVLLPGVQPAPPIEARSVLGAILSKLGPEDRMIALLLYSDGLSQGEISERLGWSRQTINKRATLIRQMALALETD